MRLHMFLFVIPCSIAMIGCRQEGRAPFVIPEMYDVFDSGCKEDYRPKEKNGLEIEDDDDPDKDGISNVREYNGGPTCAGPDVDDDGIPNYQDTDSDNDELSDKEESDLGTDPYLKDSDGDGLSDSIEQKELFSDPLDSESMGEETGQVIELPFGKGQKTLSLQFNSSPQTVDIFLLVETTALMDSIRIKLFEDAVSMVTNVGETFRNPYLGVGAVEDYLSGASNKVSYRDMPFRLLLSMTPFNEDARMWDPVIPPGGCNISQVKSPIAGAIVYKKNLQLDFADAIYALPCQYGGDSPASYATALRLTATGESHSWLDNDNEVSITAQSCPKVSGEMPRWGYPCFRADALPIVVLIAGNQFHNGPSGSYPYDNEIGKTFTYQDAVDALVKSGIRVITIFTSNTYALLDVDGREPLLTDFIELARVTRALDVDNNPLVLYVPRGEKIGENISTALSKLQEGHIKDIKGEVLAGNSNPSDVSALDFVSEFKTDTRSNGDAKGAAEGATYSSQDETTYYGVRPNTDLSYTLTLENKTIVATERPQAFQLKVRIVSDGGTFGARNLFIIIPPERAE